MRYIVIFILIYIPFSCGKERPDIVVSEDQFSMATTNDQAMITSVQVTGESNAYTFAVGVQSPDAGCAQYADWWEVITKDGRLIYRRILAHSHVGEQPFVRSGGLVPLESNQEVFVRVHMNTSGYGEQVYRGSVESGFIADILEVTFAEDLATKVPQPEGCAF